jgi:hypothetical protein
LFGGVGGLAVQFDELDRIFEKIKKSRDIDEIGLDIARLFSEYKLLSYELPEGYCIYWRGRKCDESGYKNVADLSPPPSELCANNRLNDAGSPILYAATRLETALAEIGAKEGDYVHLLGMRVPPAISLKMALVGDYFHLSRSGVSPLVGADPDKKVIRALNAKGIQDSSRTVYVDAFLREILLADWQREIEYVHSRAIAREIFARRCDLDGVIYPSVSDGSGMNVAVAVGSVASKLTVVASQVVLIRKVRRYGVYETQVISQAHGIDEHANFVLSSNPGRYPFLFFSRDPHVLRRLSESFRSLGHPDPTSDIFRAK